MMASLDVLQIEQDLLSSPLLDPKKGESAKSRGISIERKIEFLESLTGKFMVQFWQHMVTLEWSKVRGKSLTEKEKLVLNGCFAAIRFIKLSQAEKLIALDAETVPVISNLMVSNRRSRRWLNDRLLMELVPRLDAEEIRGLFAPPPWGDDVPPSPFCLTNCGEWDKFRNIDMDKEANIITTLNSSSLKRKGHVNADKIAVLNAWHRVDCRTREALRRSFLSELIEGYEDCIRAFIKESGDGDGDVLVLKVQDSFHRLLLHGVCEFYNLVSVTVTESKDSKSLKMTRIKKKKRVSPELPSITLSHFLKMSKEGIW